MDQLIKYLHTFEPLTAPFIAALTREIVPVTYPRDHLLVELAKVSDHAYFLNTGAAMSYRFIKGQKHIEEFFGAEFIVVSPKSFFERVPSLEGIVLLEESQVLQIHFEGVMKLMRTFPEANSLCRAVMNVYYEESRSRIHDFQYLNALERYAKLHARFPRIEQLAPQDHIASYLGILPQSLSRIRRDHEGF